MLIKQLSTTDTGVNELAMICYIELLVPVFMRSKICTDRPANHVKDISLYLILIEIVRNITSHENNMVKTHDLDLVIHTTI